MKFWTSTQKGDDKIIAYENETVYKANPPANLMDQCLGDLKMNDFSSNHFFSIPLRYIAQINQQENKKYLEILFRGDAEHLKVKDDIRRNEIFEFFRNNLPGAEYRVVKQSKIQAVKKPLIGMAVLLGIFIWALFIAIGMESGNEYDVSGQHYHSIAGLVIVLASLGVKKLSLTFGILLSIVGISLYKKYQNPTVKHSIIVNH
jgi:hypothetical protein